MDYSEQIKHLRSLREKETIKRQELTAEIDSVIKNFDDLIAYYEKNTILPKTVSTAIRSTSGLPTTQITKWDSYNNENGGWEGKLDAHIIRALKDAGLAITKNELDEIIYNHTGKKVETRHVLRKLKDKGKILTMSFGGSRRYVYFGLPEWVKDDGREFRVALEYAPTDYHNERINPELLIVDYKKVKSGIFAESA